MEKEGERMKYQEEKSRFVIRGVIKRFQKQKTKKLYEGETR